MIDLLNPLKLGVKLISWGDLSKMKRCGILFVMNKKHEINNNPKYVTSLELADFLRITPRTLANWRRRRVIPFLKFNARKIVYDLNEVERELRLGKATEGTGLIKPKL